MNTKDAIIAKQKKKVERVDAEYSRHLEQGPHPKKVRTGEKRDRQQEGRVVFKKKFKLYTLECLT